MKSIKTKKSFKKYIIIVVTLFALLAVGAFAATQTTLFSNKSSLDTPQSIPTDTPNTSDTVDKGPVNNVDKTSNSSDTPPTPAPVPDGKSTVSILMSAQSQDNESQLFRIRYNIAAVVTDGTCSLTLAKTGSQTVTKTSGTFQSGATTSTCQGFDIALSGLSKGIWNATLNLNSPTLVGKSTDTITVK